MNIGVSSPQTLTRKGFCCLLERVPGIRVVLDSDDPLRNLELLKNACPEILLIDALNPSTDLEMIHQLRTLFPETKIVLLFDVVDEEYQLRAIRMGVRGFFPKTGDPSELERALKLVHEGELWVDHEAARHLIGRLVRLQSSEDGNHATLTRREQEIVTLLAEGRSNKGIANLLGISDNTVRAHLAALYKKIHVNSRLEAAMYYFESLHKNSFNGLSPKSAKNSRPS